MNEREEHHRSWKINLWSPVLILWLADGEMLLHVMLFLCGRYESVIATLCENLDSLDEPEARAAMIWIVGEYAERIDNADELLESFLEGFHDESTQVCSWVYNLSLQKHVFKCNWRLDRPIIKKITQFLSICLFGAPLSTSMYQLLFLGSTCNIQMRLFHCSVPALLGSTLLDFATRT